MLLVIISCIGPVSAETNWSERLYHWYGVMKESQGLICVLLGSCVLLALILVVINLHVFSYRLQRRQHRFIARLNYLLDSRVIPTRSTSFTASSNNETASEDHSNVIATV